MIASKQPAKPDDLRMKADDFDRIMRGAIGVTPPAVEKPKPKAKKATASAPKKSAKKR